MSAPRATRRSTRGRSSRTTRSLQPAAVVAGAQARLRGRAQGRRRERERASTCSVGRGRSCEAWTSVAADLSRLPAAVRPLARADAARRVRARRRRQAVSLSSARRPQRASRFLLIPSLINRWYVLDLRPGASLVEALVGAGFDVWCLDWGIPEAEDRYLDWEAVLARLGRAVRRVQARDRRRQDRRCSATAWAAR